MNYLVDTHYLIWSLFDPDKMNAAYRQLLLDPGTTKLVSKVSYWEIALTYSLGTLGLKGITPEELLPAAQQAGYEILDISAEDLLSSYRLPQSDTHRDPFDRLLVWQCIRNKLMFISADGKVKEYTGHGLRLAREK